jgi:hypothetical protein
MFTAGGNRHPLKRKAFRDVDQIKLEDALDKYCKHVGIQSVLDLRAYNNMSTSEGVDIMAMAKLLPLVWTLVECTAS